MVLPVHRTCCEPHSTEHQMTPLSPTHAASHQPKKREGENKTLFAQATNINQIEVYMTFVQMCFIQYT